MKLEDEIQTSQFESDYHRATLNVVFTGYWLTDIWNNLFKKFDISQQQYNVLRILRGQKGKPIHLVDIQHRMIQKNSNTTRLVEKLRRKNLVERVVCEKNRRKVEITITRRGLKLLDKLDPLVKSKQEKVFKSLSSDEARQLGELLDKLRG